MERPLLDCIAIWTSIEHQGIFTQRRRTRRNASQTLRTSAPPREQFYSCCKIIRHSREWFARNQVGRILTVPKNRLTVTLISSGKGLILVIRAVNESRVAAA